MAFPHKLLNEGEEVILDLHPHWSFLAPPITAVVVALVATIFGRNIHILNFVLAAVLVLAVLWLLVRYAKWATTSLVLTNHRLVHRSGVLAKSGREIPLDHINDISYKQRIFERMIGAGDVVIESAGERGQEVFANLPKPGRIQNEIYRQIEGAKQQAGGGRQGLSIPEQIEKLDELRQRGAITQAEFDAKKAQLLDRL
jgi:membrane protein YdbS with pleckstrin-like domain